MRESATDKPPRRAKIYGVLLAVVVAIVSLALALVTHEPKKAVSSTTPTKTVVVPQMADAKSEMELVFRGKSFVAVQRRILAPFNGEITKLSVQEGDIVEKDQTIATYKLDRVSLMEVQKVLYPEAVLSLRKSITDLEIQRDKLTKVAVPLKEMKLDALRKDLANLRELFSKGLCPREAVVSREREVAAAEKDLLEVHESLKQLEASLVKARKDLEFMEEKHRRELELLEWQASRSYRGDGEQLPLDVAFIKAPIAGRIVWLAPTFTEQAEIGKGFHCVTVASLETMVVRCKVHELDLVKLKAGSRGQVQFDALPGMSFPCKVTRIPWVSRNPLLEVPADYEIECFLEDTKGLIKDGLTCNVKVSVTP